MPNEKWRCPHCRTLLGVRNGELMKIRYKSANYVVRGAVAVQTVCRICGKRVTTT